MELVKSGKYDCVAASVSLLTGESYPSISQKFENLHKGDFPFPHPWKHIPRVISVEELCSWLWENHKVGLVPFPKYPVCAPSENCPPVNVWEDSEEAFRHHLSFGEGLLEGFTDRLAHMCFWWGGKIYDPRGHKYLLSDANKYNFEPTRFWLAVWQR